MTSVAPAAVPDEERIGRLEAEFAEIAGLVNAAHGRMVELLGDAMDEDLWQGWKIHSPAHWVRWQAGLTSKRAEGLARLAQRRAELPTCVAALAAGELSVDAAIEIARLAPAGYEESITEFARSATVSQLLRCLRSYHYDDPEADGPKPSEDDTTRVGIGTDDKTGWLNATLPLDQHAIVDQALRAAHDDLYRQACQGLAADAPRPQITWADALVTMAENSLRAGQAAHPGSDRYLVHLHLDASPTPEDPTGRLSIHLGPNLPAPLRDLLLCDTALRPVFEVHGTTVSVGRTTRTISRRLRRLIEHRDGGCAVPGCTTRHGLDIHHIHHWEHGGTTDPANLVALCRRHHRLHHLGHLAIAGNPTLPQPDPEALHFADAWNRPIHPAGTPTPPDQPLHRTAARHHIHPSTYHHPLGERLDPSAVNFPPNRHTTGPPPRPAPDTEPADDDPAACADPVPPERAPHATHDTAVTHHHRTGPGTRGDPA